MNHKSQFKFSSKSISSASSQASFRSVFLFLFVTSRALDAQTLAEGLRAFGKPVTACSSIAEGVRLAKARAGARGAVLCCGSLYLLGDVLSALET